MTIALHNIGKPLFIFLLLCENSHRSKSLSVPKSILQAVLPRGFRFVQFVDLADAVEAKYQMDGRSGFSRRRIDSCFCRGNRKKPTDMRMRERR
ncbi:putative RNA-binding domain superfamily [Helianthus anomalus]